MGEPTPLERRWVSIYFMLEEDRAYHLARVPAAGGEVERIVTGPRVLSALSVGRDDRIAVLASSVDAPPEVFAVEPGGALRQLSRHNAGWLAEVELGATEEISFQSRDGTAVRGFVVKPRGYVAGRRYPTVLRIHGGPVAQFQPSSTISSRRWPRRAASFLP